MRTILSKCQNTALPEACAVGSLGVYASALEQQAADLAITAERAVETAETIEAAGERRVAEALTNAGEWRELAESRRNDLYIGLGIGAGGVAVVTTVLAILLN